MPAVIWMTSALHVEREMQTDLENAPEIQPFTLDGRPAFASTKLGDIVGTQAIGEHEVSRFETRVTRYFETVWKRSHRKHQADTRREPAHFVQAFLRPAARYFSRISASYSPNIGGAVTSSERSPSKLTGDRTVRHFP